MILSTALLCLSLNVFNEARGEPLEGKIAVAFVTMNRAGHNADKVCEEVFKPRQFSWTNKVHLPKNQEARQIAIETLEPKNKKLWEEIVQISNRVLEGSVKNPIGRARYFENPETTDANWSHKKKFVRAIGHHRFYSD